MYSFWTNLHSLKYMLVNSWGCIKQQVGSILLAFYVNSRPVHLIALSPAGVNPTPRLNLISVKHLVVETQAALSHPCNTNSSGRGGTGRLLLISWWICLQSEWRQSELWLRAELLVEHQCCAGGRHQPGNKETAGHIKHSPCATDDRCEGYWKKNGFIILASPAFKNIRKCGLFTLNAN